MNEQKRPWWLAWIVIPLALVPLGLAFLGNEGARFFVLFGSICIAAPCAGFWWGEMRGTTLEGRLGRGCLGTLAIFGIYILWALVIVPFLASHLFVIDL
ncbi:MAG: hypothetical protein ABI680_08335 [Chthoniobacteraceae bacterium]